MHLIKLDATPSTNLFLKELSSKELLEDFTVVVTDDQTLGRGQMGTKWQSEAFKNLTFSVLKNELNFGVEQRFQLGMAVSMGVFDALQGYKIPELKVKWPNDIMSCNAKICGILIENVIKGRFINKSIIGIGLNVNQTTFEGLTNVSSLKCILGREFDLEELLEIIIEKLQMYFQLLNSEELRERYEKNLFKRGELSIFETQQEEFQGYIQGIDDSGKLSVKTRNDELKTFALKEVKLIY